MKAEKNRNPNEPNLALIQYEEKLNLSFIFQKYTTKEIYIYMYNNRKERLRKDPYKSGIIYINIHNYIYSCIYNCITFKVVYYSYIYPLQLYITAVIIFNSCNNLQHEIVTLFI